MWQALSPKGDVDCGSPFGDRRQEPDVECGMRPGKRQMQSGPQSSWTAGCRRH